jgi:hypothetical protein
MPKMVEIVMLVSGDEIVTLPSRSGGSCSAPEGETEIGQTESVQEPSCVVVHGASPGFSNLAVNVQPAGLPFVAGT